jgi:3-hydroxyacyl-CoA dehydrogenase
LGDYGKMWLEPSDLLVKLAQSGGTFKSYKAK